MTNLEKQILDSVDDTPNGTLTELICKKTGRSAQALGDAFQALKTRGELLGFAGLWVTPQRFGPASLQFVEALKALHSSQPNAIGFPAVKVATAAGLNWRGKPIDRMMDHLAKEGLLIKNDAGVRALNTGIALKTRQREFLNRVVAELESQPVSTPHAHDLAKVFGVPPPAVVEIFRIGLQIGEIVQIDEQVFYTPRQLEKLQVKLHGEFTTETATVAKIRTFLGTTRKYAAPLMWLVFPDANSRNDKDEDLDDELDFVVEFE